MKKKDYQWLIWAFLLTVAILASSCSETSQSSVTTDLRDTIHIDYPYEWDSIKYNRIISKVGGETTSLNMNINVQFNEEFIEIVSTEFPEEPIIYIGRWTDKCTFLIDNNGIITINLKTRFMTITFSETMKEIYTL